MGRGRTQDKSTKVKAKVKRLTEKVPEIMLNNEGFGVDFFFF
jgi:hypothetical protein